MYIKAGSRNRSIVLGLILLTIALGLASRMSWVPLLIFPYLGDALYAVMMFFIVAFVLPTKNTRIIAGIAFLLCLMIEISQAIDWSFLVWMRSHPLIRYVVGQGFLWSDCIAYFVGISVISLIEYYFLKATRVKII